MTRRLTAAAVVVAAGAVLAGCGGSGTDMDTSIEVRGTQDFAFEPAELTAPAGEEVTVELTADETVEHNVTIEDAADVGQAEGVGDHPETPDSDLGVVHTAAGETATGTFTIDEPATYTVYCSVPGHREAGMEATLEVADGG